MKAFTIAMPYWNRQHSLSMSRLAYDKVYPDLDIEYSVCDDGSVPPLVDTQDPRMIITRLPAKTNPMNPCVPINRAVRAATREIIVLTNPEIEHTTPVFQSMLEALAGPNDYVTAACRDNIRGEWYSGEGRSMKGCIAPPKGEYHFCAMFHRSLFERAGGFDEEYRDGHCYDDNDWLFRLWALGDVNFKRVPGVVWHRRGPLQRSLWRGPLLLRNEALIRKKWGHLESRGEFMRCE